jgi:hypothetical protein
VPYGFAEFINGAQKYNLYPYEGGELNLFINFWAINLASFKGIYYFCTCKQEVVSAGF